jgi:CRISPR-associated protein Csn2
MIMKIFSLENDITFTEEYINVLQIQDKKLFTNVINSLNDNINNIEDTKERIIILDNDTEIKIEKEALMFIDVFNIDFNQKKIQSALYNKIEKIYKQEFERMSEFQTIFQKLQLNVLDVFNEFPFEFNYKESIGIQEYLKLLGLKISNNKGKITDTIFSLLDVVEYLSVAKLLIFVNIKLYLGNDEIQEVYKYAMYKKVNILLIETGEEKESLENEKILYIDSDYDEIILYNK